MSPSPHPELSSKKPFGTKVEVLNGSYQGMSKAPCGAVNSEVTHSSAGSMVGDEK